MTEHLSWHYTPPVEQDQRIHDCASHRGDVDTPRLPCDVTIMLVDDETEVRNMLARALRREGYSIVDAGDGIEALDMLTNDQGPPVHLLITDLDMPRLGGADLAQHLLATNRVRRVIFMTGGFASATLGASGHSLLLRKPFNLHALTSAVRELLAS